MKHKTMLLEEILEQAFAGYWEWDMSSGTQYLSPAYKRMLGYGDERQCDTLKSWQSNMFEQDATAVEKNLSNHVASRGRIAFYNEVRYHHKSGATVWVICTGKALNWDSAANPATMLGVTIDITAHKRAEEALAREHGHLAFIMEKTNTNFDILDTDFNLQYVDAVWQKNNGDPRGRKCYEYFMGYDAPCADCVVGKALETREVTTADHFLVKEQRWVQVYTVPFQDPEGTWLVAEFNIDITERKNAEQERLRIEQQAQQSQRLESLGLLASGIAHDFNNLMGGIFGHIDIARHCCEDTVIRGYLEKAMATIDRARGLTGQLLTFAKGGTPLRKIGSLFPLLSETAQFALSGSNVTCRFDVAEDLGECSFDKTQICQVMQNLIINAQQAMPLGGTIQVAARNVVLGDAEHPLLAPGTYIAITVTDSGTGIPVDLVPKIFDPFFTTKTTGHGLGLAACYAIVKRHGGCIDVDSHPGKGSVFQVYLPASKQSAAGVEADQSRPHRGSGMIVVMDDEEVVRNTLKVMLQSLGYAVVCTRCGEEAVSYFAQAHAEGRGVAALVFDLTVLNGMGGKEAVAEIRKLDATVPVFVSSGYADDPVITNPGAFGFTASIGKPFTQRELANMLRTHVPGNANRKK